MEFLTLSIFYLFERDAKTPQRYLPMLGELHNTNTVDKFKECDKKETISEAGKKVNSTDCHITKSNSETKHSVTLNVPINTI